MIAAVFPTGRLMSTSRTMSSHLYESNMTHTGGWYGGGGIGGMYRTVGLEQQPRRGRGGRGGGFGGGFGGRGGYGWERWATDFPDSDLNFSFRLQQLTSLKVNPNPIHRKLTDPDLCDYPFIYIIEPGGLSFSEEEAARAAAISA